jgi:signal transduction histidine kinase/ActR/RegA family two-component response regulator
MGTRDTKSTRNPSIHTKESDASREETLSSRETAVSEREVAERAREDAVALREAADRARENAAALREAAVRAREEAAQARSELDALMGQLREANEHLVVANLRSQALAEEADRANRLKDEFIAMVSHELRTPLNAVLGWARMLASKQLTEARARHAVETIERNAASVALIIDDLLDVSRISTGTLNVTSRPVDLIAVTQAAVDVVRPMAAAKHIDVRLSADASFTEIVNGDTDRLRQVIGNLLTNAIKFTPEGGHVDVSVERVGSQMEVKVADTGQGISADFLPHVFERFRQAASATSRQHGGLGLGLAIVRQLVELHGGTVHAASQGEGRGATFAIRLPIPTVGAPVERWSALADRRFAASMDSPQPRSQRLDHVHILVVDDHADGRTLTSLVLTEAGASVNAVASAREALQVLQGQWPDVLVSDIGLLDEDGYALIRQIRQHEAEHGGFLPAIALTGYARAEDRTRILAAGFQAHVSKPLDPAELTAAIAALTRGPAAAGR